MGGSPTSFSASSAAINFSSSLLCTTFSTELFWRRRRGVAATSFSFGSAPSSVLVPSHRRNSSAESTARSHIAPPLS